MAVTDVVLTSDTVELDLKSSPTYRIKATVRPSNASDKTLKYSSSSEATATVDENGLITAVSAGTAVITVSSVSNPDAYGVITVNVSAEGSGGGIGDAGTDIKWDGLPSSSITGDAAVFNEALPEPATKVTPENILALIGHYRIEYMTVQSADGFKLVDNIAGSGDNMRGEIAVNAVPCEMDSISCPAGLTIKMQFKSQFHPDIVSQGIPESIRFIRTDIYIPIASLYEIGATFDKLGADIAEDPAIPGEYVVKFTLKSPDLPMPKDYTMQVTLKKIADDEMLNPQITLDGSRYFSESSGGDIPVSGISANNKTITLETGGTASLSYSLLPLDATNKNVSFSSDNPGVADVNGAGVITARSAGTAVITLRTEDGGKTDTVKVTVTEKNIAVESVSAGEHDIDLDINPALDMRSANVTLKTMPENASDKRLKIESSSKPEALQALLKDNGDGTYTLILTAAAESASPAEVTVVSESNANAKAVIKVNISDTTVRPQSVSISPQNKTVKEGESFTLTASVLPENAYEKSVVFSSDNTGVAKVNALTGEVTAISAGTANITVKTLDGGKTDVCAVTVEKPFVKLESISVPAAITLGDNSQPTQLIVVFTPSDATDKTVTFSSSKPDIADVDASTGLITPKKAGETVITVSGADGVSASCTVTVSSSVIEVSSVAITNKPSDKELKKGGTYKLEYEVLPADATDKGVTFSVTGDALEVAQDGTVTAKKAGQATVRVVSDAASDKYDEFQFYVWETADITGKYAVESLNITYDGTTVTSSGEFTAKSYYYDKADFAISAQAGGDLEVSGKFQLVWSHFINNPAWDIFRYQYFTLSDTITERQLSADRLHEKNITLNDNGTLTYVFPFDISGGKIVYNSGSQNKLELVLNNKSAYSPVSDGKYRQVTPVNFEDPYSLQGTYDIVDFTQTNSMGNNYSVGTRDGLGYVERMIGELAINISSSASSSSRTANMTSKIQMNSSRLDGLSIGGSQEGQYSYTIFDQTNIVAEVSNFGSTGSITSGQVSVDGDYLKIYQEFTKRVVINVTIKVSTWMQKKSDNVKDLDSEKGICYFGYMDATTEANAFKRNFCTAPAIEPEYSLGVR